MGLSSIFIGTPLVRCAKSHDNGPKRLLRRARLDERRDELLAAGPRQSVPEIKTNMVCPPARLSFVTKARRGMALVRT